MDKVEARSLLEDFLADLKTRSRENLQGLLSNPICLEKTGASGVIYQIEYQAVWDEEPGGELRIIASIDDGGFLSALIPMTSGFILPPDPPGKV
jgi:hypothetical protein